LQGLLMVSGNDAAYALARGNHSVAVTLKAMNATAADLNATDTVAKDPSGLDKAGQTTSAYDLALIGRAGMKLPDFRRYVIEKQSVVPGGRSVDGKVKPAFKIGSHNKLLYNYQGRGRHQDRIHDRRQAHHCRRGHPGGQDLHRDPDGQPQRQLASGRGAAGLGLCPRHLGHPDRRAGQARRRDHTAADLGGTWPPRVPDGRITSRIASPTRAPALGRQALA